MFSTSKPSRKQAKTALKMRPAFTGKETDCETGYSYFGARYYDATLLTSFISIDRYADKYPTLSPYHYCAWNPIKLIDPTGDTLDIRGGETAQTDILSIVDSKYKDRVSFQDNRVYVNTEGLSEEEIEMDAGFSTLNKITKSEYKYLYSATEEFDRNGDPIILQNNSITPHLPNQKRNSPLPAGYQGEVIFHPNALFNNSEGGEYISNRPSTVFHELEECFQRTDNKLPYVFLDTSGKVDLNRLGAHDIAIQKATRLTPSAKSVFGREGWAYSCRIIIK